MPRGEHHPRGWHGIDGQRRDPAAGGLPRLVGGVMKTILDKTCGGGIVALRVQVLEHPDAPGEYIISLERGGLQESVCESVAELRFLANCLAAAADRIEEKSS